MQLIPKISAVNMHEWCYLEPHTFYFTLRSQQWRCTIDQWYVFDGASIPRFFWTPTGLTPGGLLLAPSGTHDWLFQHRGGDVRLEILGFQKNWNPVSVELTREEVDYIFYQQMLKVPLGKFNTQLVYKYVRRYGWLVWRKETKGPRYLPEDQRQLFI